MEEEREEKEEEERRWKRRTRTQTRVMSGHILTNSNVNTGLDANADRN